MESTDLKKRGRGRPRKRRREDENDASDKKLCIAIKQALDKRWRPLVGRYVLKEFAGNGIFLGKVAYYDSGLYRVDYEDGDCEDLDSGELRQIILGDEYFDEDLSVRRKKLDELILSKSASNKKDVEKSVASKKNGVNSVESSAPSELSGGFVVENDETQDEGDVDSSSDSCEYARDRDLEAEVETPAVPPPILPPSSGTVGIPEAYVSHLFSVYTFLRSFNILLFLSPFTLDDLVGAINCDVQNTLLDAIHVALMHALRRHLETLSSEGLELASKCLRCADWNLLDSLTWPVYLVHYFVVMGYVERLEWKGFYDDLLKREYFTLPVDKKLMILQILCDDVLDSAEVRTEIDMREESEFGIDPDAIITTLPETGPRRVHPRYSKTSACKNREVMEIISESHATRSSCTSKYLGSEGAERVTNASDDVDRNSDECRLCGMNGTLLCCDSCPSAYHSRCIGVAKMYIPNGPWYCPECTISKLGPKSTVGTSLRGAEIFGIDLYEQVFLGTCDHLVVLTSAFNKKSCLRYYSLKDIPNVLQALSATVQHKSIYMGISKAITEHWHIPQSVFSPLGMMESSLKSEPVREVERYSAVLLTSPCKESSEVPDVFDAANIIGLNRSSVDDARVSCPDGSASATVQFDHHCNSSNTSNSEATKRGNCHLMSMKLSEQTKVDPSVSAGRQHNLIDTTNQNLIDRSSGTELVACASVTSNGSHVGQVNANFLPAFMSSQSKEGHHVGFGNAERNSENDYSYVGTFFKPYAYINHYVHGEFAASAASNLAILSSEESRVSEAHKSGSNKKNSSDISLQAKAFSISVSRFFWPSSEKKLMEVPRERCGWCYSCMSSTNSKKGCMLNAAALTATKGAMKILTGLRPTMKGEGSLPNIATYILYMGEVLGGLKVGPFLNASYRKQWRKQVEDASTFSAMKHPLLDLEKHLRTITLSADWVKSVDDWLVGSFAFQNSANTVGTTQKRGPSGKRQRKQSGIYDVIDDPNDKSFCWWRGGKILKRVFHKAILPLLMVTRAARQGGSRKIAGINYASDDSEIPKRSKQLVWRAAVERSSNTSQLALQVRYLDHHVRWSDLFRPDQNLQDGKGPETEASVFRNAAICERKIEGNKGTYGVAFGSQKHLPSRVMKNVIRLEHNEDGKDKFWFSETYVPLYLIKEYEESQSLDKVALPMAEKPVNDLSDLQRMQLKASRKDIFSYLECRRDGLDKCYCASCQHDVLLRNAVKCSTCQGYIHKECTVSSTVHQCEDLKSLITCKQCYHPKTAAYSGTYHSYPVNPSPMQRRECNSAVTVAKGMKIKGQNEPLTSGRAKEIHSEMKQATRSSSLAVKSNRPRNWGIIWKKKNIEDAGIDFRRRNILFRGTSDRNLLLRPQCYLCNKPYDCNLIYIQCEHCSKWYHADALELEESKISEVVGFKCCKCRSIKRPLCPYKAVQEQPKELKSDEKAFMERKRELDSNFSTTVKSVKSELTVESRCHPTVESKCEPTTVFHREASLVGDDDPLLFSLSRVEQVAKEDTGGDLEWTGAGMGPQKLPVRRQTKHQGDIDTVPANDLYHADIAAPTETNTITNTKMSCAGWSLSNVGDVDQTLFDYSIEDMEFEPQTYFSFTELLESDDGGQLDGNDASENAIGNAINQSNEAAHDSSYGNAPPSPKSPVRLMHCKMCSNSELAPELSCEICGLLIHRHCSPWVEPLPSEGCWRCGRCREWR